LPITIRRRQPPVKDWPSRQSGKRAGRHLADPGTAISRLRYFVAAGLA